jgi:anti-sigma B factor antagonist
LTTKELAVVVLSVLSSDVAPFLSHDRDRAVVWLEGEHDIATVSILTDTLTRAISADDADVIVDLSGVTFIDAATVGVLISARNSLHRESRSLMLRSPSRFAGRVLDLCGLRPAVAVRQAQLR